MTDIDPFVDMYNEIVQMRPIQTDTMRHPRLYLIGPFTNIQSHGHGESECTPQQKPRNDLSQRWSVIDTVKLTLCTEEQQLNTICVDVGKIEPKGKSNGKGNDNGKGEGKPKGNSKGKQGSGSQGSEPYTKGTGNNCGTHATCSGSGHTVTAQMNGNGSVRTDGDEKIKPKEAPTKPPTI